MSALEEAARGARRMGEFIHYADTADRTHEEPVELGRDVKVTWAGEQRTFPAGTRGTLVERKDTVVRVRVRGIPVPLCLDADAIAPRLELVPTPAPSTLERQPDRPTLVVEPEPEPEPEPEFIPPDPVIAAAIARGYANRSGRQGRRYTDDELLASIRRWAEEHGSPPKSADWVHSGAWWPCSAVVIRAFGSWANGIEAAGFPRPLRGGYLAHPRPAHAEASPATRERESWIHVRGTGLAYRTVDECWIAADEVEHDGERVATNARRSGDEAKADLAIDRARALAGKIREAAREHEARAIAAGVTEAPPADEASVSPQRAAALKLLDAFREFVDVAWPA